jgi:hypothetical protein
MNKRDLTREQMAKIFEDFLKGTGGKWDWEAFTDGYPLSDSRLEVIRVRSMNLPTEFSLRHAGNTPTSKVDRCSATISPA